METQKSTIAQCSQQIQSILENQMQILEQATISNKLEAIQNSILLDDLETFSQLWTENEDNRLTDKMMIWSAFRSPKCLEFLLSSSNYPIDESNKSEKGESLLVHAINSDASLSVIQVILRFKASICKMDDSDSVPLFNVISLGNSDVLNLFLQNAETNIDMIHPKFHYSPLLFAISIKSWDIVKMLLNHGANPLLTFQNQNILHVLAKLGKNCTVEMSDEIIQACLHNISVMLKQPQESLKNKFFNQSFSEEQYTPLHLALLQGNFSFAHCLIKHAGKETNLFIPTKSGITPLLMIIGWVNGQICSDIDLVQLIIDASPINQPISSDSTLTPFIYVVQLVHGPFPELIKQKASKLLPYFMKKGGDLKNALKQSPLLRLESTFSSVEKNLNETSSNENNTEEDTNSVNKTASNPEESSINQLDTSTTSINSSDLPSPIHSSIDPEELDQMPSPLSFEDNSSDV